jgi:transposase
VNLNAAGIDVGAGAHWVAVPEGRDTESVREFGAFTSDLYAVADWLEQCAVETVVMESTGVYWVNLFEVLSERGFEVLLVDPHKLKEVPGRKKTDVLDCQWLQRLHTFGLLSSAFRPADEICVLRSYTRQRAMLVRYAASHIQHMQKALTQMNVKLDRVVREITGVTGMTIIRAIVAGERDPQILSEFRDPRCRNSQEVLAKALQGHWREEHLFELQQAVELYDVYQSKIAACDEQIESCLHGFGDHSGGSQLPPSKRKGKKPKGNAPAFDLREDLFYLTGVDLTQIDGIDAYTALKLVSEIGLDMTRWASVKHFTSWLALCPGNRITGGRILSARTCPSANRAAAALRQAAQTLYRSHSALGAYLRRMKARLGAPKAITATAHKIARIVYTLLRNGSEYVDPGQDYYEQRYRDRIVQNMKRKAKAFGYTLVKNTDPQPSADQ